MRGTMVKDEIGKPLRLTARCDDCANPKLGEKARSASEKKNRKLSGFAWQQNGNKDLFEILLKKQQAGGNHDKEVL